MIRRYKWNLIALVLLDAGVFVCWGPWRGIIVTLVAIAEAALIYGGGRLYFRLSSSSRLRPSRRY